MRLSNVLAVSSAILALTACGQPTQRGYYEETCVDRSGRVVDDDYCEDRRHYGGGGYFIYMLPYNTYAPGSQVSGLSNYSKSPKPLGTKLSSQTFYREVPRTTTNSNGVSRGGFGTTARSYSSNQSAGG